MQKWRPTCSQEDSARARANCLALVYNHGFPKAAGVKPPTNYSDLTEALQVPIGRQRRVGMASSRMQNEITLLPQESSIHGEQVRLAPNYNRANQE
jgi:hypothetical protein